MFLCTSVKGLKFLSPGAKERSTNSTDTYKHNIGERARSPEQDPVVQLHLKKRNFSQDTNVHILDREDMMFEREVKEANVEYRLWPTPPAVRDL